MHIHQGYHGQCGLKQVYTQKNGRIEARSLRNDYLTTVQQVKDRKASI